MSPGGRHIQNCNCLCYDKDSCLWIGCNNGLYRFNESKEEVRHYGFCSDPGKSPIRTVKSIIVDETGNIYAGTENGLVRYIQERAFTVTTQSLQCFNSPTVRYLQGLRTG